MFPVNHRNREGLNGCQGLNENLAVYQQMRPTVIRSQIRAAESQKP